MGGRGVFVWVSYGVSLVVMLVLAIVSLAERNMIIREAQKQKARVERIMAARAAKAAAKKEKAGTQAIQK